MNISWITLIKKFLSGIHCKCLICTLTHLQSELWICMELMSTCLGKLLRHTRCAPVPEPIIGKMTVSIVRALHFLKSKHQIMHRGGITCTKCTRLQT